MSSRAPEDVASCSKELRETDVGHEFYDEDEGTCQQITLHQPPDIVSSRLRLKRNLGVPADGAISSKKLREEDDDQKPVVEKGETHGELISPIDESSPYQVQLSESIFMFPKRKMSSHGNVFEGEIRSGVYGIRSCVIKFAEISEQNVREARILSKLGSHTNVIAIVQSGTYSDILEDRFYLALDKCHEENLRQYLSNRKNAGVEFDLEQANDFAHQLIEGVMYIHDNKVVHSDLKPSNILLSLNQRLIKIADFGLSRELKSTSSKFRFMGQFGTDGYRPTESFGDGWVSLRSDIFSLGAVFYHLLSNGEEVFGDDEHKYIYNVNNNVIDMSRLLLPNSKATEHLIKLMLNMERCRRPTIWQVAEHPCWTGNKVECNFDYGCAEEIDDSDDQVPESKNQDSDSDIDTESQHKVAQALKEMKIRRPAVRKSSIIIFEENSERLQCFTPRKTVTQMHEFNIEMKQNPRFSSVSIRDDIYVLMSDRVMYRLKYRDVAAKWERMADLIYDHGMYPPAVVASRSIIVAGGSGLTFTKAVTKFNPSLNRWEKLKDKQLDTRGSANVASQRYVYSLGGNVDGIAIDRVERLNVSSQLWDEVAPMRRVRYDASAAECGRNLFVVGGQDRVGKELNSVEKYDPVENQWTIVKPMTTRRRWFRCYSIDGNIYAVGPKKEGIERYDVEKDAWEDVEIPEMKNFRIYESILVKMK